MLTVRPSNVKRYRKTINDLQLFLLIEIILVIEEKINMKYNILSLVEVDMTAAHIISNTRLHS